MNRNSPLKISIVSPSFNQGRFLADAIESVAQQSYRNIEHIIVDAASTDETLDILDGYHHLPHLKWISEPDDGQTDAINKGFRMATGDVIAWLNADDYYLPGAFHRVVDAFSHDPSLGVLYGEATFVSENKASLRHKRDHAFDYGILLYYGCYIMSTATFFHRRIIDAGHLLDTDYHVVMDYEYFVRLAKLGYRFQFLPEVLAAFRWHENNISLTFARKRREERLRVQHAYGFKLTSNHALQTRMYDLAATAFRAKRLLRKWIEAPARKARSEA